MAVPNIPTYAGAVLVCVVISEHFCRYKVILLGTIDVGKTSLIVRIAVTHNL